jgi:hypothetical protein
VVLLLHRGDDSSGLFGTAFPQERPQDGVLALVVQAQDEADLLSVVRDDRGAPGVARRDVADGLGKETELPAHHGVRHVHVAHVRHGFVGCLYHGYLNR